MRHRRAELPTPIKPIENGFGIIVLFISILSDSRGGVWRYRSEKEGVTALCVPLQSGRSVLDYIEGRNLFALYTVPVAGLSTGYSLRGGQESTALEVRRPQRVISGMSLSLECVNSKLHKLAHELPLLTIQILDDGSVEQSLCTPRALHSLQVREASPPYTASPAPDKYRPASISTYLYSTNNRSHHINSHNA